MTGRVLRPEHPLPPAPGLIRLGTRRSRLAVAQSTQVAQEIARTTGADVALVTVTTEGDVSRAPLSQLGGTGVFVSALREALYAGTCDMAVHSFKDLPTAPCPGISVGAVPLRADARDAWCARDGLTLIEMPPGSRVGTGSPRRAAQILSRRPDLIIEDIRGNVDTRLARVGADLDAVILAAAGLERVGRVDAITERFSLDLAPSAPGQGALAIEVRSDDLSHELISQALRAVDHAETRAAAAAERTLLAALEAGCAAPVGASANIAHGHLSLRARVYQVDGQSQLESFKTVTWDTANAREGIASDLGSEVARDLLERGAAKLADLGPKDNRT